jgi:hypothetical protein
MTRALWAVAIVVVIALGVSFIIVEKDLAALDRGGLALQGRLPDGPREVIDLNLELFKIFSTLSTAVLGGVAFYLHKKDTQRTRGSRAIAIIVSLSVVVSLFFGHLWIAMMRNQVANDFFNPVATSLVWCERLQYGFFLIAIALFAMLVLVEDFSSAPSTRASR